MWDDEAWELLASRHLQLVRQTGALAILPIALSNRAAVHVTAGELHQAAALMEEAEAVTQAIGSRLGPYAGLTMAATRGREAETLALVDATLQEVESEGQGIGVNLAYWAQALLYNGLGRYETALAAAQKANDYPEHFWAMAELVEAGSRSGKTSAARDALERLSIITQSAGTDWALGFESRCRALVSTGDIAEDFYREAIERLGKTRARLDLARAQLLYGEWLRRENRRVDARSQLRTSFESLSAMGVEGFAARARRELTATGETVRKRANETIDRLTTQEAQIGRLAAEGRTNVEIASELFLSNRTVEWHLRKVYAKLGVGSRKELAGALPPDRAATVPAA
jgi:ATP/maltotriose-dependent transcriptional regulator MalT